jgi:hypothetical protein
MIHTFITSQIFKGDKKKEAFVSVGAHMIDCQIIFSFVCGISHYGLLFFPSISFSFSLVLAKFGFACLPFSFQLYFPPRFLAWCSIMANDEGLPEISAPPMRILRGIKFYFNLKNSPLLAVLFRFFGENCRFLGLLKNHDQRFYDFEFSFQ